MPTPIGPRTGEDQSLVTPPRRRRRSRNSSTRPRTPRASAREGTKRSTVPSTDSMLRRAQYLDMLGFLAPNVSITAVAAALTWNG